MAPGKTQPDAPGPTKGYCHAARTAVQETTLRVQEMHSAIASTYFGILRRIPLVSLPAQLVQQAHDTIATGVYGAIRHAGGGFLEVAAMAEKHATGFVPGKPPGQLVSGLRSALNGAFGDHLAASNNLLAIRMAIRIAGAAIPPDAASLRAAFPEAGPRLCVFIHGLGCDEHCWQTDKAATQGGDFGRQLHAELAYTPLYLCYNTGLPILDNARRLASLLEDLLTSWPIPSSEMVIIGHSMGGLVALAACETAAAAGMAWPHSTRMLICLGSPILGSTVERLGEFTTSALNQLKVTAPLGKIAAARSQGIKDLRSGPGAPENAAVHDHIAFRFLGASLAENSEHPFAKLLGDGLVTPASATAHAIDGDVESVRLGKLSHMALLNDARVYLQLRKWLAALDAEVAATP